MGVLERQRRMLAQLQPLSARDEALRALVTRYRNEAGTGRPVHEWGDAL